MHRFHFRRARVVSDDQKSIPYAIQTHARVLPTEFLLLYGNQFIPPKELVKLLNAYTSGGMVTASYKTYTRHERIWFKRGYLHGPYVINKKAFLMTAAESNFSDWTGKVVYHYYLQGGTLHAVLLAAEPEFDFVYRLQKSRRAVEEFARRNGWF